MIRSLYFQPDQKLQEDLTVEAFAQALQNKEGLLWVDFEGTLPESDEPILREVFHFHPLAIDDALQESHVPKIDDWSDYLYIVLHAVVFENQQEGNLDTLELDIFVGKNFLVTHHDKPIKAVEYLWDITHRDDRHLKGGADHLLYRLTDEIVASYMPVVEELAEAIDQTEDEIFDRPSSNTLERVFSLKRSALHMRRILGPQREVLNKLARDEFPVIDARARIYFRDVYDHLVRMHDISESIRDLVSGTLETYLSVVNNRMNDIIKTLTIITTLFMPLSFVASFFGMNFFGPVADLKEWTDIPSLIITLSIMLATPLVMFAYMRRRGWM